MSRKIAMMIAMLVGALAGTGVNAGPYWQSEGAVAVQQPTDAEEYRRQQQERYRAHQRAEAKQDRPAHGREQLLQRWRHREQKRDGASVFAINTPHQSKLWSMGPR